MSVARVINITILLTCAFVTVNFARRKEQPSYHGRVTLADGSFPQLLIIIERSCKDRIELITFADSQGRFSFDSGEPAECQIRAYIPGYISQTVPTTPELGTLILRSRGTNDFLAGRESSVKDVAKNKFVWAPYEKGLDDAAKGKWRDADDEFHIATKMGPWFPSGWLCLGIVQEHEDDPVAAKKSYKEAIKTDEGFILPYVYAAALEVTRGDWKEALDDSKKILQADAKAFPSALLAGAWANLNLHNMDEAEKNAQEGLQLDTEHRFPELEYILGLVFLDRRDPDNAKVHFKNYLALDPHGRRAEAARAEVAKP